METEPVDNLFEGMDESYVRLLLTTEKMDKSKVHAATLWLAHRDAASRLESASSQAEQTLIARSASDAAWEAAKAARDSANAALDQAEAAKEANRLATNANTIATVAIIIAIMAASLSIIGIFMSHHR